MSFWGRNKASVSSLVKVHVHVELDFSFIAINNQTHGCVNYEYKWQYQGLKSRQDRILSTTFYLNVFFLKKNINFVHVLKGASGHDLIWSSF